MNDQECVVMVLENVEAEIIIDPGSLIDVGRDLKSMNNLLKDHWVEINYRYRVPEVFNC